MRDETNDSSDTPIISIPGATRVLPEVRHGGAPALHAAPSPKPEGTTVATAISDGDFSDHRDRWAAQQPSRA